MHRKQHQVRVLGQHVDQRSTRLLQTHGNGPAAKPLLQAGCPDLDGFRGIVQFSSFKPLRASGEEPPEILPAAQSMATNAAHSGSGGADVANSDIGISCFPTGWPGSYESLIV